MSSPFLTPKQAAEVAQFSPKYGYRQIVKWAKAGRFPKGDILHNGRSFLVTIPGLKYVMDKNAEKLLKRYGGAR